MWYVMKGQCVVNGIVQFAHGPSFVFPEGAWHEAKNLTSEPCHILECQYGEECTEDDIVRDYRK